MNAAEFTIPDMDEARKSLGENWHEFLSVPSLSMGLYLIPAGTNDRDCHSPHDRDEIYVGVRGQGQLTADGTQHTVEAGSVVYVKAGVELHFHDVVEDLSVLVFFAGSAAAGREKQE